MVGSSNLKYGTYYSSQSQGGPSKMAKLLVVGLIVVVIISGGLFLLGNLGSAYKSDLTLLAVRENSLLQLVNASQKSIKNDTLATANSNAGILLASDVTGVITSTGIKKLPDNLVKQEADTNTDKLKQAALLDKFDMTYRKVVLEKITALTSEATKIRASAPNKTSQTQVDKIITNLDSVNKQFTDVNVE